ncbi:MAG: beta-sandwich domain-containing protein [Flavobacteriia bacterium]|jgi:hypothetical protein
MKSKITLLFLVLSNLSFGQGAPGEIVGTIIDKESNDTLIGAQVFVIDQDRKYQSMTGSDGRFRITAIPAGEYTLNVKYVQDTMTNIVVKVPMDGIYNTGTIRFTGVKMLKGITVVANDGRMKLEYGSLPIKELTTEEIEKSPAKFSVASLATTMSSEVKMSEDGELMFRGARKGDMIYMLDGIKSNDVNNVPSCAIGRMMVYTGGLPAKYGDTLGGAVVVETLSYFDLYRQWEREELKKDK